MIPGLGSAVNNSIYQFEKYHDFEELKFIHIQKPVENSNIKTTKITGKTFCITGTFSESRSILQKKIESCGGIFTSGITRKTEVLFVGESAGSKLQKAKDLGITIVTEDSLGEWI